LNAVDKIKKIREAVINIVIRREIVSLSNGGNSFFVVDVVISEIMGGN
jgi:hypothetical protein